MANRVGFWHLSDLHLRPCCHRRDDPWTCLADPCHVNIKLDLLLRIAKHLQQIDEPPRLLLISGDIFDYYNPEWAERCYELHLRPLIDAARMRDVEVCGILSDEVHDRGAVKLVPRWPWLMRAGDPPRVVSGIHVVASGATQEPTPPGIPCVLLNHARKVETRSRYSYSALGHIHWSQLVTHDSLHFSGRPGHLYSYWDGPGKAWPVHMIMGSISVPDGHTEARLVPLEETPFLAPATRQIYGEFGEYDVPSGTLTLVHAPRDRPRSPERRLIKTGAFVETFPYCTQDQRDQIIRMILSDSPDDIFVTPATGKRNAPRAFRARHLISNEPLFTQFVKQSFKPKPGTMTSDT